MAKRRTPNINFDLAAEMGKLFGDATRLRIIAMLTVAACCVGEICGKLNLPQPTVSHHLGLLRMSKVVNGKRNGKQVVYSLTAKGHDAIGDLNQIVSAAIA